MVTLILVTEQNELAVVFQRLVSLFIFLRPCKYHRPHFVHAFSVGFVISTTIAETMGRDIEIKLRHRVIFAFVTLAFQRTPHALSEYGSALVVTCVFVKP